MANTITAGNATNNGIAVSGDNTGTLNIITGSGSGTTAIAIDASQNVTVSGNMTASGTLAVTSNQTIGGNLTVTGTITGTGGVTGGVGTGQTWQDVTASRSLSTTYTNSTAKPIVVSYGGLCGGANSNVAITVGGITQTAVALANNYFITTSIIVPPSTTYSITASASITTPKWVELR
jgi:hypothetical protein